MDGLSAAKHSPGSSAVAAMARFNESGAKSKSLLSYLVPGSSWILYLFYAAGVLHVACDPGSGSAGWRLAGKRRRIGGIRISRLNNFLLGAFCNHRAWIDRRHRFAFLVESAGARRRSRRPIKEKSS